MKNDKKKISFKTLAMYGAFGLAIAFAVTVFVYWMNNQIVQPIPMAVLIGVLIWLAIKLFSDAVRRESKDN